MSIKYNELKSKLRRLECKVCELQSEGGGVETDPIFSASPAFGITTPNITAWNALVTNPVTNYITTNTNQTGLTGDKTTSGLWNFQAPWANGQANLGSIGQAGLIRFANGANGAYSLSLGYVGAVTSGALLNSSLTDGLTIRNTAASGFVSIEAANASGYLNFIAGSAQAMRLFPTGNLRIGTSTTDDGSKLRVDGLVTITAGILPSTSGNQDLGSTANLFSVVYSNTISGGTSGALRLVSGTAAQPIFFRTTTALTTGVIFGTTGNVAFQNPTTTPTDDLSGLQLKHSITAASAIARGMNITSTLTAAANNDVLVGLDINPTFTNVGGFTGVSNYSLRVTGNIQSIIGASDTKFSNIIGGGFWSIHTGGVTPTTANYNFASNGGTTSLRGSTSVNLWGGTVQGLQLNSAGRTLIQNAGTFTDSGEQFQVVGTSKLAGNVGTTGTIISTLDHEVTTIGSGFILKSPDGTRYKVSVANGGAISTVLA